MSDYTCARCGGSIITSDICIICGAYIAPPVERIFIRSISEPCWFKNPKALHDRKCLEAAYSERLEHLHKREAEYRRKRRAQKKVSQKIFD